MVPPLLSLLANYLAAIPKFNGSENFSFLRVLYLVFEMLLKENYFAADEVKSLICTVFIKADDEMILFSVCPNST